MEKFWQSRCCNHGLREHCYGKGKRYGVYFHWLGLCASGFASSSTDDWVAAAMRRRLSFLWQKRGEGLGRRKSTWLTPMISGWVPRGNEQLLGRLIRLMTELCPQRQFHVCWKAMYTCGTSKWHGASCRSHTSFVQDLLLETEAYSACLSFSLNKNLFLKIWSLSPRKGSQGKAVGSHLCRSQIQGRRELNPDQPSHLWSMWAPLTWTSPEETTIILTGTRIKITMQRTICSVSIRSSCLFSC